MPPCEPAGCNVEELLPDVLCEGVGVADTAGVEAAEPLEDAGAVGAGAVTAEAGADTAAPAGEEAGERPVVPFALVSPLKRTMARTVPTAAAMTTARLMVRTEVISVPTPECMLIVWSAPTPASAQSRPAIKLPPCSCHSWRSHLA